MTVVLEDAAVSPSLQKAARAYELKFLLDEMLGAETEDWALRRLTLDPHGDPLLHGAYHTTSLYCDTPELDVYHRSPAYRRRKYRVRRYGASPVLFLERKTRSGDRVAKRRTAISENQLAPLEQPLSVVDWPGQWFHRRLLAQRLEPACRMQYERRAYVGSSTEGPLRMTLDRHLHGILTRKWTVEPLEDGLPLLNGRVILELKFPVAMPWVFKELVRDLRLCTCAVSKYRLCREAWGMPDALRKVAHA